MKMEFKYFTTTAASASERDYLFPSLRIVRIAEGSAEWLIGKTPVNCSAGNILLLNNLTARRITQVLLSPFTVEVFEFSPDKVRDFPKVTSAFYNQSVTKFCDQQTINSTLDMIADNFDRFQNDEFFEHQLMSVFCLLENLCSDTVKAVESIGFTAAKYIWDNYSFNLTVPFVAQRLNVSKSHLESAFKNVHGIAVAEYIRCIRIYNVMVELKKYPNRSVLDIALANGFKSASGFYKAFKTITGHTPKNII
jgi:AraC-like DNA-binding protein